MSNINDFVINEDGTLVEYIGTETDVIIPDSVKCIGIGNGLFSSANVKSVIIPKSVKSICGCAFSGCETLESIVIPNSVKTIGMGAFRQCSSLKSVILPESLKAIEPSMFEYCKALESVTFGKSVKKIGRGILFGCSELKRINFNGTIAEFNQISKGDRWDSRTGEYTCYCTDGERIK